MTRQKDVGVSQTSVDAAHTSCSGVVQEKEMQRKYENEVLESPRDSRRSSRLLSGIETATPSTWLSDGDFEERRLSMTGCEDSERPDGIQIRERQCDSPETLRKIGHDDSTTLAAHSAEALGQAHQLPVGGVELGYASEMRLPRVKEQAVSSHPEKTASHHLFCKNPTAPGLDPPRMTEESEEEASNGEAAVQFDLRAQELKDFQTDISPCVIDGNPAESTPKSKSWHAEKERDRQDEKAIENTETAVATSVEVVRPLYTSESTDWSAGCTPQQAVSVSNAKGPRDWPTVDLPKYQRSTEDAGKPLWSHTVNAPPMGTNLANLGNSSYRNNESQQGPFSTSPLKPKESPNSNDLRLSPKHNADGVCSKADKVCSKIDVGRALSLLGSPGNVSRSSFPPVTSRQHKAGINPGTISSVHAIRTSAITLNASLNNVSTHHYQMASGTSRPAYGQPTAIQWDSELRCTALSCGGQIAEKRSDQDSVASETMWRPSDGEILFKLARQVVERRVSRKDGALSSLTSSSRRLGQINSGGSEGQAADQEFLPPCTVGNKGGVIPCAWKPEKRVRNQSAFCTNENRTESKLPASSTEHAGTKKEMSDKQLMVQEPMASSKLPVSQSERRQEAESKNGHIQNGLCGTEVEESVVEERGGAADAGPRDDLDSQQWREVENSEIDQILSATFEMMPWLDWEG